MDMAEFLRTAPGRTYQRDGEANFDEVVALFIEARSKGWIDVFMEHHDDRHDSGIDLFTIAGLTGEGRRRLDSPQAAAERRA